MKQITIFGGTGMTGVCTVFAAIEKGLKVKLLVRDKTKIPEDQADQVDTVVGDVLNYNDVLKAVDGSSSVVVVLGTRNNLEYSTVMSDGLKNILAAMEEKNINIISTCLSAFLFYSDDKVPAIFNNIHAEHKLMHKLLRESKFNWIGVCPPHIADNPPREIVTAIDSHPGPRVISKRSLGKFLVNAVDVPAYYKHLVGIADEPQ